MKANEVTLFFSGGECKCIPKDEYDALMTELSELRKQKDPNDELWERAKNAAHGEWVAIDPESKVSGFIRYAKDIQDELDTMSKEYAAKTKANEIDRYAIPAMHAILSGRIDFVTTMDVAAKAYSQAEDMIAERNKRTQ